MRTEFSSGAILALLSFTVVPGRRSLVNSQSLATLPTCAQPAILGAIQGSGCQITDKKCFCSNPALIPSLTSAVQEACSSADQAALAAFASTYCGSNVGGALTSSPTATANSSPPTSSGSPTTTLPPAIGSESSSVSISSSTVTSTANMTMTMNSTMSTSSTMTLSSTSPIHWPTNVTTGGAVAETGLAMAALAVAAGAMGLVLGEL